MKTAATDGDATERAIAAAEPPFVDRAGPAAGPADDPGTMQGALSIELVELERELGGIGMLVGQARAEAARPEIRRVKADERVTALENDPRSTPDELRDARQQLVAQTR